MPRQSSKKCPTIWHTQDVRAKQMAFFCLSAEARLLAASPRSERTASTLRRPLPSLLTLSNQRSGDIPFLQYLCPLIDVIALYL